MRQASKALAILLVSSLGLWGCAQGPATKAASLERLRALEAKNSKLEDDLRSALAVRDQLKRRLAALEEQRDQLQGQLESLRNAARERDLARQELNARTNERDHLQGQLDLLRKGIRDLLGQTEAAGQESKVTPVTTATKESPETRS